MASLYFRLLGSMSTRGDWSPDFGAWDLELEIVPSLEKVRDGEADLRDEHHSVHVCPGDMVLLNREILRPAEHQVADVDAVRRHDQGQEVQKHGVACEDAQPHAE